MSLVGKGIVNLSWPGPRLDKALAPSSTSLRARNWERVTEKRHE